MQAFLDDLQVPFTNNIVGNFRSAEVRWLFVAFAVICPPYESRVMPGWLNWLLFLMVGPAHRFGNLVVTLEQINFMDKVLLEKRPLREVASYQVRRSTLGPVDG